MEEPNSPPQTNGILSFLNTSNFFIFDRLAVRRDNVTAHGNGTISAIPVYTYTFDPENSVGPESDTFTAMNIPMTVSTCSKSIEEGQNLNKSNTFLAMNTPMTVGYTLGCIKRPHSYHYFLS